VRDDVGEDVGGKVGHQVAAHGGHFVRALCHPRERKKTDNLQIGGENVEGLHSKNR
jgi:hypothetical protein